MLALETGANRPLLPDNRNILTRMLCNMEVLRKTARAIGELAIPTMTAVSLYFLAKNCGDKEGRECLEDEPYLFYATLFGGIYTAMRIFHLMGRYNNRFNAN